MYWVDRLFVYKLSRNFKKYSFLLVIFLDELLYILPFRKKIIYLKYLVFRDEFFSSGHYK